MNIGISIPYNQMQSHGMNVSPERDRLIWPKRNGSITDIVVFDCIVFVVVCSIQAHSDMLD